MYSSYIYLITKCYFTLSVHKYSLNILKPIENYITRKTLLLLKGYAQQQLLAVALPISLFLYAKLNV